MFVSLRETFACGCPGIWYPNFINSKEDFPLSGVDAFASSLLTAHSRSPYFEIGKEATANLALAAMQPQCFGMVVAGLNAFQLLPQKDGKQVWVC